MSEIISDDMLSRIGDAEGVRAEHAVLFGELHGPMDYPSDVMAKIALELTALDAAHHELFADPTKEPHIILSDN